MEMLAEPLVGLNERQHEESDAVTAKPAVLRALPLTLQLPGTPGDGAKAAEPAGPGGAQGAASNQLLGCRVPTQKSVRPAFRL